MNPTILPPAKGKLLRRQVWQSVKMKENSGFKPVVVLLRDALCSGISAQDTLYEWHPARHNQVTGAMKKWDL